MSEAVDPWRGSGARVEPFDPDKLFNESEEPGPEPHIEFS